MSDELKTEKMKLGTGKQEREVTFTQLPATARTLRLLSPLLAKKTDNGENIRALIDAIVVSLSYTYDPAEVEDILDLIPLKEDSQLLEKIAGVMFRGLQ